MAYLGRPSQGDSPFAIGDKAMRDTSSPQPPSQRNPTPRQMAPPGTPSFGSMQAPSPYGSVSDEARRRYEERYAKKKAEEAAKAEEEARKANPQYNQGPQQQGYGGQQGQGGYPQQQSPPPPQQQQHQQYGGYNNGPPPPAGGPRYNSPPMNQQRPFSPSGSQNSMHSQHSQPGYNPPYPHGQPPQQAGRPGPMQQPPPGGYNAPNQQYQQQPPPNQQRYSNPPPPHSASGGNGGPGGPGGQPGPRWSSNAVPPPSQQWNKPQSPPPPSPHMEDPELRHMFNQFDSSRSGQLNSYDLQRLLAKDNTIDAREDCVKMHFVSCLVLILDIFDTDRSGSINFMEFEGLYRYIQDWHGIFNRFDRDHSGLIDRKELHQALLGFGFSLPSEMVKKLEKRFSPPPAPGGNANRGISFDRFLMACVTVKHYTEAFRRVDTRNEGRLTLDYNQFMNMMLDSPS